MPYNDDAREPSSVTGQAIAAVVGSAAIATVAYGTVKSAGALGKGAMTLVNNAPEIIEEVSKSERGKKAIDTVNKARDKFKAKKDTGEKKVRETISNVGQGVGRKIGEIEEGVRKVKGEHLNKRNGVSQLSKEDADQLHDKWKSSQSNNSKYMPM